MIVVRAYGVIHERVVVARRKQFYAFLVVRAVVARYAVIPGIMDVDARTIVVCAVVTF